MSERKEITKVQEIAYELRVKDAMKKNVICTSPATLIKDLREVFKKYRISGIPVVEGDTLVGIISLEDFIKALSNAEVEVPVREKMTKNVEVLYADESLISAMSKFENFSFGRFPVLERETNKLVGIITKGDIISTLLKQLESEYMEKELKRLRITHILEDISADEVILTLKYSIKGKDFKNAGEVSSRIKRSLSNLRIPSSVIRSVAIATYEAEMNIVIFAEYGEITVYAKPDQIRVEALDKGPGIPDIEKALQPGFSTAPEWVRELGFGAGMGLPNIKNCTDMMEISSKVGEGTRLEFVVYMNGGNR